MEIPASEHFPLEVRDVDPDEAAELMKYYTANLSTCIYPTSEHLPLEVRDVEPEEAEKLMKYFTDESTGFVRVGPKGYFMPHKYKQEAASIYNMPLRDTDVFVAGFPRSGTTWTQEMVWQIANDLDFDKAAKTPLTLRFPFLEFSILCHPKREKELVELNKNSKEKLKSLRYRLDPGSEVVAGLPSPRFMKTHLPLSLLPPALLDTCKVVYVARDPRDVAVSYFHLHNHISVIGFSGDFKEFWKLFVEDTVYWSPFFENLKEAWELRHHSNLVFLFYEDSLKDLAGGVRRVSRFLGKQFSEQQIEQLCQHLSFENFKNNSSVDDTFFKGVGLARTGRQKFIRKGRSGGWRDYFDDEMAQQAERWIADNLRGTDLRFPHF